MLPQWIADISDKKIIQLKSVPEVGFAFEFRAIFALLVFGSCHFTFVKLTFGKRGTLHDWTTPYYCENISTKSKFGYCVATDCEKFLFEIIFVLLQVTVQVRKYWLLWRSRRSLSVKQLCCRDQLIIYHRLGVTALIIEYPKISGFFIFAAIWWDRSTRTT